MAHVTIPNISVSSTTDQLQGMWRLTRGLLAAGWKYKASADGLVKESAGVTSADRWAIGGAINTVQVGAQTGAAPVVGAPSSGVSTVTGVSGFTSASVGRYLQITGMVNILNNGIFRITAQAGTTVSIFNPNAVSETGSSTAAWSERHGGTTASIAAAGTAGATPGRAIITGISGMIVPTTNSRGSTGNRLHLLNATTGANNGSFLITRVLSSTSVEIENASATADASNGSIIWVEVSPTNQAFPSASVGTTVGCWINLQGPSTLRIPIGTNTPTVPFLKGENIIQSTTGATGEVLGVTIDTSGGTGYLVVAPRLNGSGGGVRGWATANNITGSISGAVVAQSGTAIEYVREMVIWGRGVTRDTGHIYCQVVDQAGETASRFSTLATAGSATVTICPGGATGTFPAVGSWVTAGTGGSNAAGTGAFQFSSTQSAPSIGATHVMCANCIPTSSASEDGSFWILWGSPGTNSSAYTGVGWMFCENSEDGDVDPYAYMAPGTGSAYGGSRTVVTSGFAAQDGMYVTSWSSTSNTWCRGTRRRGLGTGDAFQEFHIATLGYNMSSSLVTSTNPSNPERVACSADPRAYPYREPIWIVSVQPSSKMRKGTPRWLYAVQGGISNAWYQNGTFIGLGSSATGVLVAGPWDGTTAAFNG